ncbi:MAG: aminotransferase class V-fold PLP-dependent enzyme [Rhodobacteraceae bacterium]|nr:aminotransferase class V-fold PLP-dependent enzyme [Paracoccaceae bacterium]
MDRSPRQLQLAAATRAAQALRHIDPVTGAVTPAIELSSTYARDDQGEGRQPYIYARSGGPTIKTAEALLADLDGGEDAMVFASGMAAIVTVLETLRAGDHVVAPDVMYHGVINWLLHIEQTRGVKVTLFDATVPAALANAVRAETALVWIESPINPNWDVIDIAAAAKVAHAVGARLVVDSTVAPACTTRALDLGADIVFQSATKYLGGHSDITAGVLTCAQANDFWAELQEIRTLTGNVMAAFEAWLLVRGIRTLFLRYERASSNAMKFAQHFENHPKIQSVIYPGLASHPGHSIAKKQMKNGFGGMLSLQVKDYQTAHDISRFVQVFINATSLGGVESLIEHRIKVEGPNSIVPDTLLRLSIGIEDVNDLIADLEQALERAG